MAHFKRKRRKEYTVSYCGSRHCKYDLGKLAGNGRLRYTPQMYKHMPYNGSRPWRYKDGYQGW